MNSSSNSNNGDSNENIKPIYEIIVENIGAKGKLPKDFQLDETLSNNENLKFIPGAEDGIYIYHCNKNTDKSISKQFISLLEKALKEPNNDLEIPIINFLKENRVITLIDDISEEIYSEQTKINPDNIINTAYDWLVNSSNVELTKLSLALIGLLDIEKDITYRNAILTLGKYEEFTLYTLVAISSWEDSDELIFELAKQVHGWGKIHALERISPKNPEIKNWILNHGCQNRVLNEYLALTCANKGDLISVLRNDEIDLELFKNISIIMEALLSDIRPVSGISDYVYSDEAKELYFKHLEKKFLNNEIDNKFFEQYKNIL